MRCDRCKAKHVKQYMTLGRKGEALCLDCGAIDELENSGSKMREALSFYADESNYDYDYAVDTGGGSNVSNDGGELARQTLEDCDDNPNIM